MPYGRGDRSQQASAATAPAECRAPATTSEAKTASRSSAVKAPYDGPPGSGGLSTAPTSRVLLLQNCNSIEHSKELPISDERTAGKQPRIDPADPHKAPLPDTLGYKRVVADRIKWQYSPTFDPVPYLSDPVVRAVFLQPNFLELSPELWPALPAAQVHADRSELLKLAAKWDAKQALRLIPVHEVADASLPVGVFSVPKSDTHDRLILNRPPLTPDLLRIPISRSTSRRGPLRVRCIFHLLRTLGSALTIYPKCTTLLPCHMTGANATLFGWFFSRKRFNIFRCTIVGFMIAPAMLLSHPWPWAITWPLK